MPQREFYAKYVDNSSYTSLIDGGQASCRLAYSDSSQTMTTLLFDPDGINTLPNSATINSLHLKLACKVNSSMTMMGIQACRAFMTDSYTLGSNIFNATNGMYYSHERVTIPSSDSGTATDGGKFRWTSMTSATMPSLHYNMVYGVSSLKQGCFVSLWAFKNANTLANTVSLENIRLVVDYILPGYYIARISGVGMSSTDEVYIKQDPSWTINEGLDCQLEQSTPAYYCAKATNGKIITKIECKDLDGTLWTKDAAQLKAEGALNANQTELTYESTSTKHTEHEIIVHFGNKGSSTITTSVSPKGSGTTTGDGTYEFGATFNITATANPGCTISSMRTYKDGVLMGEVFADVLDPYLDAEHKKVNIPGTIDGGLAGCTLHYEFVFDGSPGSNVYLGNTLVDVYVGTTLVDVYVGTTLI